MKQYCRYCGYLVTRSGIWCSIQEKEVSRAAACSPNRCHSFAYQPVDAFGGGKHSRPEKKKPKRDQCEGQESLFK